MIGIICAMDSELEGILEHIADRHERTESGYVFHTGKIRGRSVAAVRGGIGKVNIAVCTELLILKYKPDVIINSGVAGSLSGKFSVLDVAVVERCVQHDFDTSAIGDPVGFVSTVNMLYFPADKALVGIIDNACAQLGVKHAFATIASGDQFIADSDKKAYIRDTFKADVCDMESAAIAQVCHINDVPCAFIRVISDSTDDEHSMEYSEFMPLAARTAVDVLLKTSELL